MAPTAHGVGPETGKRPSSDASTSSESSGDSTENAKQASKKAKTGNRTAGDEYSRHSQKHGGKNSLAKAVTFAEAMVGDIFHVLKFVNCLSHREFIKRFLLQEFDKETAVHVERTQSFNKIYGKVTEKIRSRRHTCIDAIQDVVVCK